jgi:hypothetical protein
MLSKRYYEDNSELKVHSGMRHAITPPLSFLVSLRITNMVGAAKAEGARTNRSEMVSTLIAHAPNQEEALSSKLMRYLHLEVADLTPEVDEAKIPQSKRSESLHEFGLKSVGLRLPELIYARARCLTDTLHLYRPNYSDLIGSIIVDAETEPRGLAERIFEYRDVKIGDFDPDAEFALATPAS